MQFNLPLYVIKATYHRNKRTGVLTACYQREGKFFTCDFAAGNIDQCAQYETEITTLQKWMDFNRELSRDPDMEIMDLSEVLELEF